MPDAFDELPAALRERILELVGPPDPETWARTPIPALNNRTVLDVAADPDGNEQLARYLDRVEQLEKGRVTSAGALAAALKFTPDDLAANRGGRISPAQRQRLLKSDLWKLAIAAGCLVGGILLTILTVTAVQQHEHIGRGIGAGPALVLIGGGFGWISWRLWLDLSSGSVASVGGPLTRREATSAGRYGSATHFYFDIGGESFEVSSEAYDATSDGPRRAFYLPRTKTLLSLEAS